MQPVPLFISFRKFQGEGQDPGVVTPDQADHSPEKGLAVFAGKMPEGRHKCSHAGRRGAAWVQKKAKGVVSGEGAGYHIRVIAAAC